MWSETQTPTPSDPDAVGVTVGVVQGELAERLAASEVVGEEAVLAPVQDPTPSRARTRCRGPPGCDRRARCRAPAGARRSPRSWAKRRLRPLSETQMVVRSEQTPRGRAVAFIQLELALLDAFAALEVVGVDSVVGAVAVLEEPERGAVGPHPGGLVVAGVEFVDVVLDGPLEVDFAGTRPRWSPTPTADDDRWSYRAGCDRDGHIDACSGVGLVATVVGFEP